MKQILTTLVLFCPILVMGQPLPDLDLEECKPSIGWWENLGQVIDANGNPVSRVKLYSEGANHERCFRIVRASLSP